MQARKPRVESPQRCIRTRGLSAAARALSEFGPHASLERVAELAGCPKASLARVFDSKEALFVAALDELDRLALLSMRLAASQAGWGRAGAMAAAIGSTMGAGSEPARAFAVNGYGSELALCPWAQAPVMRHKRNVVALYAEALIHELPEPRAWVRARAIALITDGFLVNAAAGQSITCSEAALLALRGVIEPD